MTQKAGISFEIGEKVKVCDGPFASFNGLIEEIDEENLDLKCQFLYLQGNPVDLGLIRWRKLDGKRNSRLRKITDQRWSSKSSSTSRAAVGQRGINIMEFCKAFNEKTKAFMGKPVPVVITVYKDKKFDFIIKSPSITFY